MKLKLIPQLVAVIHLLINLCFCIPAYSQSDMEPRTVDSLRAIWNNKQATDTIRLNALEIIVNEAYMYANPDSAYKLAQIQYEFATSRGLKKHQAFALRSMGGASRLLGEYERGKSHYLDAIKIHKSLGDKKEVANELVHLGTICHEQGDYASALNYYQQGLEALKLAEDSIGTANVLGNIGMLYEETGEYKPALEHLEQSFQIFEKLKMPRGMSAVSGAMANVYKGQGNHARAIECLMRSLKIDESANDKYGISFNLNDIGIIYETQKDYTKAIEYYEASLRVKEELNDRIGIAVQKNNLGHLYRILGNFDQSLEMLHESLIIKEELNDKRGIATTLGNIGLVYEDLGQFDQAKEHLYRSLELQREIKSPVDGASTLTILGRIYLTEGDANQAVKYATQSLQISRIAGLTAETGNAAHVLYQAYKRLNKHSEALEMHMLYRVMTDSIMSEENQKELLRQQFQYDFQKREAMLRAEQETRDALATEELRRRNLERNAFIGGFALMLLLAIVFLTQRNRISREKKHSDSLLLNILPAETALELKTTGAAKARQFDKVTVLFTDFADFGEEAEKLDPEMLVSLINECFSAFDRIMGKHGVEKIKTIGDSYMAAGGLPTSNNTHPADVVRAALEIQQFMAEFQSKHSPFFEIRIGINTGPVVAGIVGIKKFQYDIWGDTVNTASRMESNGEPGFVNISETTYQMVKDEFNCTFRGEIEAKGKGLLRMYRVQAD